MGKMDKNQAYDKYEYLYNELKKTVESTTLEIEMVASKTKNVSQFELDKANFVISGNKNKATMLLGMVGITRNQCKLLGIDSEEYNEKQLECSKVEVIDSGDK